MAKDTFWFKHDYHSRSDKEMMRLRMKMGMKGIGIYWCIVEMLYEEDGYLLRSEYERIAFELQSNYDEIKCVIDDYNLFKKDEEKFWSETLIKRLNEKKEKSVKTRESVNKRWGNTNVLQSNNESNTIRGEENRIDKEKNKKKENNFYPIAGNYNGIPEDKIPAAIETHTLAFGVGIVESDVKRFWEVFKVENLTGENYYQSDEKIYTHFIRWIKKHPLNKPQKTENGNQPKINLK